MTELYQIYYEESQRSHIFPFAIPHFNDELTPFFENSVIVDLVSRTKAEKIGVCSWQLREKLKFHLPPKRELTEEVINSDYDVILLSKNSNSHQMLARANAWHVRFTEILFKIFDAVGFSMRGTEVLPDRVVYFNHFVARTEIYKQYILELLSPAMEVMSNDEEIKKMIWIDSGYETLKGFIPDRIKQAWGYYPMHPFLCERMFSCWLNGKNFNIVNL